MARASLNQEIEKKKMHSREHSPAPVRCQLIGKKSPGVHSGNRPLGHSRSRLNIPVKNLAMLFSPTNQDCRRLRALSQFGQPMLVISRVSCRLSLADRTSPAKNASEGFVTQDADRHRDFEAVEPRMREGTGINRLLPKSRRSCGIPRFQ